MMLGMINASGICPIGNKSVCCGYGDIAELAGEALIEAQRMLVAANMETMR
jgi:hypothetical protein